MACAPGQAQSSCQQNGSTSIPPIVNEGWPTKDEYVRSHLDVATVEHSQMVKLEYEYRNMVRHAVIKGEIGFELSIALVGKDDAYTFRHQFLNAHGHTFTLENFLADEAIRLSQFNRGQKIAAHHDLVTKAIAGKRPVPAEVLVDYPDLCPSPTPAWKLPQLDWTEAEANRWNQPVFRRGGTERYAQYEYVLGQPQKRQASVLLKVLKQQYPDYQWEIDIDNESRKTVCFTGRRAIQPVDLRQPAEFISQHHDDVERALQAGQPVAEEIRLQYPDLIAQYGL